MAEEQPSMATADVRNEHQTSKVARGIEYFRKRQQRNQNERSSIDCHKEFPRGDRCLRTGYGGIMTKIVEL